MNEFSRPKLEKPIGKPVTLIVGIMCKDGIVVAADSQTSWQTGKRYDAQKMVDIRHYHGRALVAQSGATITSQAVIEELEQMANVPGMFESPSLSGLAAKACRKVRDKLRFQHFGCSAEEFQNIIRNEGLDCTLMIADKTETGRSIDTVSLSVGMPARAQSYFESIGSGSDLATMLLTDLCTPDMDVSLASIIAAHVVEVVKRHDQWCGGPTRLGIIPVRLFDPPEPSLEETDAEALMDQLRLAYLTFLHSVDAAPVVMSQADTEEIVRMAAEVDAATKQTRGEIMREALKKRSEADFETIPS